jgi:hypothetical protein
MKKNLIRLVWWFTYIVGALVLQQQIPGVDALTPGFLLALQEKNPWRTFWLFLVFVLIQEGCGSLHFGSAILWYGGQAAFFRIGERFFVSDNFLFVFMLSLVLGVYHVLLVMFMCAVQGLPVEYVALLRESILQALLIPLVWGVVYISRPRSTYSI